MDWELARGRRPGERKGRGDLSGAFGRDEEGGLYESESQNAGTYSHDLRSGLSERGYIYFRVGGP